MSTVGQAIMELGAKRAGLLLLIAALLVGWTSRGVASQFLGGLGTHEQRLSSLEEWRQIHEDSVEAVGMQRIMDLERAGDARSASLLRVEQMVYQLFCDRWPDRCESFPIRKEEGVEQ